MNKNFSEFWSILIVFEMDDFNLIQVIIQCCSWPKCQYERYTGWLARLNPITLGWWVKRLSLLYRRRHDTHQNDTQHIGLICNTQHNSLSINFIQRYSKHTTLCWVSFPECRDYLNIMLSVVMLNVVMLSFLMLNVVMLIFLMLNVVMLNVVMLNVVMLSAVRRVRGLLGTT